MIQRECIICHEDYSNKRAQSSLCFWLTFTVPLNTNNFGMDAMYVGNSCYITLTRVTVVNLKIRAYHASCAFHLYSIYQ